MKNRKAAISIEMIVYVAIAVFVLVIVIGFATGAFQKLIPAFTRDDVKEAQDDCSLSCSDAKADVQSKGVGAWETSPYCTKTYPIKVGKETELFNCWNDPIGETCEVYKQVAGKTWLCTTHGEEEGAGAPGCGCAEAVPAAPAA